MNKHIKLNSILESWMQEIFSVFPAEACETVGGEACDVEMYPEVKLTQPESKSSQARTASEMVDREYLDYNNSKT